MVLPSATTVATWPTSKSAMSLMLTVVVASYPPVPSTTIVAVVEPAETSSPVARFTSVTVPAIGLTIDAWARACVADSTANRAASTEYW